MANCPATEITRFAIGSFGRLNPTSINGFFASTTAANASSPPYVTNIILPTNRYGNAQFDVLDDSGLFRAIYCLVGFDSHYQVKEIPTEVVHMDNGVRVAFSYPYSGTRTALALGFRYLVHRARGGWPLLDTTFHALPIDRGGKSG